MEGLLENYETKIRKEFLENNYKNMKEFWKINLHNMEGVFWKIN